MYESLSLGRSFCLHELSMDKMLMHTDATDNAGDLEVVEGGGQWGTRRDAKRARVGQGQSGRRVILGTHVHARTTLCPGC